MKLSYRGYEHDENEVWFTVSKDSIYDSFERGRGHKATWVITGVRQASSAADLTADLQEMEDAYGVDGGDLIFTDNDGQITAHSVYNADTFGGTKVRSFRYLKGNPGVWGSEAEYVNKRTFQIVVEATILVFRYDYLAYRETVMTIGGGPQDAWVPSAKGKPQRQRLKDHTPYKTVQVGTAMGDLTYPLPSTPVWPEFQHIDRTRGELVTPRFVDGGQTEFVVRWKFEFESDRPLIGGPTVIIL